MNTKLKTTGALLVISLTLFGCNSIPPQTTVTPVDQLPTANAEETTTEPADNTTVDATTPDATTPDTTTPDTTTPSTTTTPVAEKTTVRVYFNNPEKDPNWAFECSNVLAIEREIPKTKSVAMAAITELLKGPTSSEKAAGYVSNINTGVIVQKLTIENGTAKIDFNEQLQYQVGGSCKTSAIIAQIKETLKQFPTIKDVVISINGQSEDILQP